MHSQHGTTAAEDLFTSLNRGSRSAGAAATTTTTFSTSNKNIRSTSASSNHRNLIDRTGTDAGTRGHGKNCVEQEISISPKDDKDLFSDVEDSSDDEADISRLQQERHHRHKDVRPNIGSHKNSMAATSSSLGNSSSPNIPISHHATSASSSSQLPSHSKDINFKTQSVRGRAGAQTNVTSTSTSTTSMKTSRGPLSDVEIATPHPNGQQTKTQKTSTGKAASSISPVVVQHPKPSSSSKKKKPRKKLVLTNSRKRRMKLIAKKSVLEQQRLKSLSSSQELKCSTGDCRVRDLEKFHYGKNGEFLSGSKIPTIFTNKTTTEDAKGSWKAIPCTTDLSLRSGIKFPTQYSWTDNAATSCLEELGWNHNPRLHQFTLNEIDQVLQVSMDRIRLVVKRAKYRLPVYEQGILLDPTVVGKMEEEILLQKIQHDIDILASVRDTFYVTDVSPPVQNNCFETSTGDEHMDFSNSNSHHEEQLEDIQDMTTNSPSGVSQESMLKANNAAPKLCKITKYFPKFVGDSNELLLTEQIIAYFSRPKLKITLKEHTEDNDTSVVILCGLKDDIDAVLKSIVNVIQKKIVHYNCDLLHSHKDRIEVDVKFDITQELGVKTVKATKSIWIQNVASGGQFEQIFGSRLGGGAAIVSMGFFKSGAMEPIFSNKSKNAFLRRAKEALYRDDKEFNKWIVVRICMLKDDKFDVHRALMAANRLVHQNKSNLWQNGKAKRMVKPSHKASEEESKVSIDTSSMSRKRKQPSPRSESTSGSPSEEVSRKKLDLKDRSNAAKAITDKDSSYRHFRDKTQPLREIEFKSRMNGHAACGSMWMQHKKLFGEHCDPNCNCVSEMDKLVANIVLEGKSLEARDKIGFADSFCPRFFDKVQKYFPKDSAEQVLSKLVEMWKLGHIKQRTLGGSCDASCSCGNLWSLLFLPICRGDLPQKSDSKQFSNSHNKENISEENTIFDITFRPSTSSLGFYCETKVCDKSKQVCVVRSVDPGKKAVSKITPGTIIECYTLGQQTVRVSTHHQLERVYNVLKTRGDKSPITLRFKKKKELSDEKTIDCSRDWSKTNAWVGGSSNQGWAGGAMVIKGRTGYNHATGNSAKDSAKALKHRERFLPQSAKETIREKMKGSKICGRIPSAPNPNGAKSANIESSGKISENGDVGTKMKPLRLDSVAPLKRIAPYVGKATEPSRHAINYPTKLHSKYPSNSKVYPPKSILRTERQKTQNRSKVTFDLSRNLVNTYIPDTYISIAPENKGVKFTEEKLTEAIMCGQHLERFVEMLKHCVHDFKYETPLQTLANRIKELNEENENLTKENLSSAEMSERKLQIEKDLHQFDMKKKIVKIYAKAHQLLRTIGNSTPDVIKVGIIEHVESHSIEITKQIITLHDWLMRFRDEASEAGITLKVDANVDVYGVSLAHAAVFVGDSNLLQTLIKGGAQMKTSKSLGTPHQLAQFLLNQALMKGNLTWTKKYMKVISVLENIRSQN